MNNSVQCVNCARFTFQGHGGIAMAKQGFGNCKGDADWVYYSPSRPRECQNFSRASEAVIGPRVEFINKLGAKNGNS